MQGSTLKMKPKRETSTLFFLISSPTPPPHGSTTPQPVKVSTKFMLFSTVEVTLVLTTAMTVSKGRYYGLVSGAHLTKKPLSGMNNVHYGIASYASSKNVYCIVQCSPDILGSSCHDCLAEALTRIQQHIKDEVQKENMSIAKTARDQEAGSNFLIDPLKQDQAQEALSYNLPSPQARRHILSLGMKAELGVDPRNAPPTIKLGIGKNEPRLKL
ncbi:hypothetical protein Cgig2_032181 [Carnegiea gigantea]|uniref:Gnk2-homologous domain-containing protein n=1 Tax=Carnegiea gigantea TaxID=171969 RepID=A0A9Q1GM54_9CARY|nr:hypothetical protein Cgig2_032181 [Carnegiea gigantea]